MQNHKNSQKRFYELYYPVFITTNTNNRYPFFNENILCELFIETLFFCAKIKKYEISAFKINPDHLHLIIIPDASTDYSKIMGSIKRNFARDCNNMLNDRDFIRSKSADETLREAAIRIATSESSILTLDILSDHLTKLEILLNSFHEKYRLKLPFNYFKWQNSFNYWILKSEKDFYNKMKYIMRQSEHHNLTENKYLYISEMYKVEDSQNINSNNSHN